MRGSKKKELFFEETLLDDWAKDLEVVEVPLEEKPLRWVAIMVVVLGAAVMGRALFLGTVRAGFYAERAEINLGKYERLPAPRGMIYDRFGKVLAENRRVFSVFLEGGEFLRHPEFQEETLRVANEVLGVEAEEIWQAIKERDPEINAEPILLRTDLNQSQIIRLRSSNLPTLRLENTFQREYPQGEVFSSILGYVGLTTAEDLRREPELSGKDFIGKTGIEAFYDRYLRGATGWRVKIRDAKGNVLDERVEKQPQAGKDLTLTVDADLEFYFYERLQEGLKSLGRRSGAGLAINPKNGEILALVSFPTFDNNVFTLSGRAAERLKILSDSGKPVFNRAISGLYAPGSTIKPLVGVAALAEGVISPQRTVFSPGYMEIPNPYSPSTPTRFLDWRYQGNVDLHAAIAQSSNVYFYLVGGGSVRGLMPPEITGGNGIEGLGISRLREWWEKFGLGKPTGVDLPGEEEGFLPSPEWKEKTNKRPWLLGDTYNVSIGQGDILVTPLQLLTYISAIASGGTAYRPFLKLGNQPQALYDLTAWREEIGEVQKGMRQAVTSPQGTAHLLADLAIAVAGKTGSAQIEGNRAENAFFVGYAPYDDPQIAILVLVENARQGSLNAVPIARAVFDWYYWNRIRKAQ